MAEGKGHLDASCSEGLTSLRCQGPFCSSGTEVEADCTEPHHPPGFCSLFGPPLYLTVHRGGVVPSAFVLEYIRSRHEFVGERMLQSSTSHALGDLFGLFSKSGC